MKKIHEKNNNQIASRSKIFMAAALDFCIHMVLLMLIFGAIAVPSLNASNLYNGFYEKRDEFFNYIEDTRLYTFDEEGNPINSNYEAANYITKLVRTTYFYEGLEYSEIVNGEAKVINLTNEDTINYVDSDGNYVNDNLAHYFLSYRESIESDLPDNVKNDYDDFSNKFSYFYNGALKLNLPSLKVYFNSEIYSDSDGIINEYVSDKPLLTKTTAELLHSYVCLNEPNEEAERIVDNLLNMYNGAINFAFEELDTYSPKYGELLAEVDGSQNFVLNMQFVSLVLSYVVSFLIYWVIIPIFLKEGRSVGFKICRLTYSDTKDNYPEVKRIVIKDALLFLTQAISLVMPILFMGNINILYAGVGGFSFMYLLIFFLLITVSSVILAARSKKHQFLGEFASNLVVKDIDSLKVSENNAIIDEPNKLDIEK